MRSLYYLLICWFSNTQFFFSFSFELKHMDLIFAMNIGRIKIFVYTPPINLIRLSTGSLLSQALIEGPIGTRVR